MRKWEDIVKDKLGGYESNLPEDSLAAFHARRASAGTMKAKRFPLVWAIVPAIAAGLIPRSNAAANKTERSDFMVASINIQRCTVHLSQIK